jgi:hypothetical protein
MVYSLLSLVQKEVVVEVDPIDFCSWICWHNKVYLRLDHGPEPGVNIASSFFVPIHISSVDHILIN